MRYGAERCTAGPGPPHAPSPLRSRVCSAPLRFAPCCAALGTHRGSPPVDEHLAKQLAPLFEILHESRALGEVDLLVRRVAVFQALAGRVVADLLVHLLAFL